LTLVKKIIGDLFHIPNSDKDSPRKLRVRGTAELDIVNMKNSIVNTGIVKANPL
jgi:hypothetical protein